MLWLATADGGGAGRGNGDLNLAEGRYEFGPLCSFYVLGSERSFNYWQTAGMEAGFALSGPWSMVGREGKHVSAAKVEELAMANNNDALTFAVKLLKLTKLRSYLRIGFNESRGMKPPTARVHGLDISIVHAAK